jgi:hypothetical protein
MRIVGIGAPFQIPGFLTRDSVVGGTKDVHRSEPHSCRIALVAERHDGGDVEWDHGGPSDSN